jgi:hypothetical protein
MMVDNTSLVSSCYKIPNRKRIRLGYHLLNQNRLRSWKAGKEQII